MNERRVVLMNASDIKEQGFRDGSVVDILSSYKGVERRANRFIIVDYPIPQGAVATYFPEANALVPIDQFAIKSMTPASKSVVVSFILHEPS